MPLFKSIIKSGPQPYREDTFQEWEAKEKEKRLKSEYVISLIQIPQKRNYPSPHFEIKSLYSSADFNNRKTKTLLRRATDAIKNNDFEALEKTLGHSAIPFRILHAQSTQRRRWAWPAPFRTLQFYKQAESLFWWYQKKFFFDTLPPAINIYQGIVKTHPKTRRKTTRKGPLLQQAMDSIRHYHDRIIPASYSADHSEFLLDLYARNMEAEENKLSKKWLEFLIASQSTDHFKDAAARRKATKETRRALIDILRTQLADFTFNHAVKNQFADDEPAPDEQKSFSLSALIDNLEPSTVHYAVESPEPFSDSDLNLEDISDEEQTLLAENEKTQVKQFILWLNKRMLRKVDILVIGKEIAELIQEQLDICVELVKDQLRGNELLNEKEIQLEEKLSDDAKAADIANIYLDDAPVSAKNPLPLLHLALEKYANAKTEVDQNSAFQPVAMLIGRGCSPYLSLPVYTVDQSRTKSSALEYAVPPLDWRLLTCILRYTLPHIPCAEKMRQMLLDYCFNASEHSKSMKYRIFHPAKSGHIELVSKLVAVLHDPRFNKSEPSLMTEINHLRNNNKVNFFKPKIFQLLDDILPKKDKKAARNDVVEMGSLRSENNSPQSPAIDDLLSDDKIFSALDIERDVLPDTGYTTIQTGRRAI